MDAEYVRQRRAKLKAEGICPACGKNRPATGITCAACRRENRKRLKSFRLFGTGRKITTGEVIAALKKFKGSRKDAAAYLRVRREFIYEKVRAAKAQGLKVPKPPPQTFKQLHRDPRPCEIRRRAARIREGWTPKEQRSRQVQKPQPVMPFCCGLTGEELQTEFDTDEIVVSDE